MSKTILVTGGAGFIGSYVNKMLHQSKYQTVVIDNLVHGDIKNVCYGTFIKGDLADNNLLCQIFSDYHIDAVMHFAAFIDVGESVREPGKYYQNNVSHTINLLNTMRQFNVNKFIFSSTAAIFGHPLQPLINEDHPYQPINPYGEAKLMVEKILADCARAYDLKFYCLRYFNAAGGDPDRQIKYSFLHVSNLIPRILCSLRSATPLIIFGTDYPTIDGTCIRDYIHINDLSTAHVAALEQLLAGAPSNYYNLGNGKGFSVREVIQATEKVLAIKITTIEGKRRAGDPAILLADPGKARRELYWQPRYSLEKMIEHAANI